MGLPLLDEALFSDIDHVRTDGQGIVVFEQFSYDFIRQRIGQPGLAAAVFVDFFKNFG